MSWLRVLDAVLKAAGDKAVLAASSSARWAAGMFDGSRHTAILRFIGEEAMLVGEAFIAELPNFPDLPGYQVVEAKAIWVNRTANPNELTVQVELLLLDDRKAA